MGGPPAIIPGGAIGGPFAIPGGAIGGPPIIPGGAIGGPPITPGGGIGGMDDIAVAAAVAVGWGSAGQQEQTSQQLAAVVRKQARR